MAFEVSVSDATKGQQGKVYKFTKTENGKTVTFTVFDTDGDGIDKNDGVKVSGDTSIFAAQEFQDAIAKDTTTKGGENVKAYDDKDTNRTTDDVEKLKKTYTEITKNEKGEINLKGDKTYRLGELVEKFKPSPTPTPTSTPTSTPTPTAITIPTFYSGAGTIAAMAGTGDLSGVVATESLLLDGIYAKLYGFMNSLCPPTTQTTPTSGTGTPTTVNPTIVLDTTKTQETEEERKQRLEREQKEHTTVKTKTTSVELVERPNSADNTKTVLDITIDLKYELEKGNNIGLKKEINNLINQYVTAKGNSKISKFTLDNMLATIARKKYNLDKIEEKRNFDTKANPGKITISAGLTEFGGTPAADTEKGKTNADITAYLGKSEDKKRNSLDKFQLACSILQHKNLIALQTGANSNSKNPKVIALNADIEKLEAERKKLQNQLKKGCDNPNIVQNRLDAIATQIDEDKKKLQALNKSKETKKPSADSIAIKKIQDEVNAVETSDQFKSLETQISNYKNHKIPHTAANKKLYIANINKMIDILNKEIKKLDEQENELWDKHPFKTTWDLDFKSAVTEKSPIGEIRKQGWALKGKVNQLKKDLQAVK